MPVTLPASGISAGLSTSPLRPAASDLIRIGSRRWFLQTGLAGMAGLTIPDLLQAKDATSSAGSGRRSVVMFWLSGGPSHIDMWDPKTAAPREIR